MSFFPVSDGKILRRISMKLKIFKKDNKDVEGPGSYSHGRYLFWKIEHIKDYNMKKV
jgi:hypothetical protein